jgi:hypothetical protein
MQALSKMLVLLLLAAVIAAPLAAQELRPGISSQERPAGCHEPAGNVPAPGPTSHSCCQSGHHPAILQQSSISRLSLQGSALMEYCDHAAVVVALGHLPSLVIVSGDPPLTSPLRV